MIKFICAILVVMVHVSPVPVENEAIHYIIKKCISRIAVPFYFTSAGYFLFKKMDINCLNQDRIKNYCIKILRLLGTWTILLYVGETYQLWFLGALVIAVLVLSLFLKMHMPFLMIAFISSLLYFIGLLGDSYYGLIERFLEFRPLALLNHHYYKLFETTRNGLFMGTMFIFLGLFLTYKRIKIKPLLSAVFLIISIGICRSIYII